MAYLPIAPSGLRHHFEPAAADVSFERRAAGSDRCIGGGLFCEGFWHYLPRATTQRTRRTRPRGLTYNVDWAGTPHCRVYSSRPFPHGFSAAVRSADQTID